MAKNILILDTGKEWGGGTNSLLELLKRVDKSRYRFSALFYTNYEKGDDSSIKTEIEKLGITFILLKQKKAPLGIKVLKEIIRTFFFFSKRLKKHLIFLVDYQSRIKNNAKKISGILKKQNIDLLYMNNQPSSNLEGILASEMTQVPSLQHARIDAHLNPAEIKAANRVLKKIICVSGGVKESFLRQGIEPALCTVVYNGISSEVSPGLMRDEIRESLHVSDKEILIGTVGSLIKRKRIHDLINALHIITAITDHAVKCVIIGEGPERDNLVALAKKKKIYDSIIFTGFQTDAVSYINAMDIFVMTSEKEGLPRVILEAMLMKKAVVASDITGAAELIEEGKSGLLIPLGNAEKFASSIIELMKDHELRREMGDNANKRVIDLFSIEKYIHGVENVFAEILRQ